MEEENAKKRCCNDLCETLKLICVLQKNASCCREVGGCERPCLGPVLPSGCYNTRPINLYSCCSGELWRMPYTLNGTSYTSTVFRVEKVENCCATCRCLAPNTGTDSATRPYLSTNSFFTINLECCLALTCLDDTYVELC